MYLYYICTQHIRSYFKWLVFIDMCMYTLYTIKSTFLEYTTNSIQSGVESNETIVDTPELFITKYFSSNIRKRNQIVFGFHRQRGKTRYWIQETSSFSKMSSNLFIVVLVVSNSLRLTFYLLFFSWILM